MRPLKYGLLILAASSLIACSGPAEEAQSRETQTFPEEPRASEPSSAQRASFQEVEGEVISVSPEDQILTVRTDHGQEVEVTYSPDTEVIGSQQGTQGLATVQKSRVRISYREGVLANTAIRVEVEQ